MNMGKKDTLTKEYMSDNHVFADLMNYLMYDGKPVVQPERLRKLDGTVITVPYGTDGAMIPIQKYRDVLKELTIRCDDSAVYLLLGIENQSDVHYAMPVKNMVYDALSYAGQVEEAAKTNRKHMKVHGEKNLSMTPGEYLYGFCKADRLVPVITVVVYFGADEWDAPESLHEMFSVEDKAVLAFVPDYKLNLIAPANMMDDEINRLTTELREVLLFIKYSKDKRQLAKILENDRGFRSLERKTVQLINVLTNSDIKVEESEGDGKVCIAIDGIRADAREEGALKERKDIALSMLKSGNLSYEQISEYTKVSVEDLEKMDMRA